MNRRTPYENFSYLIQQQQLNSFALTQYVITRSVSTTVMHGTTTGIIGATLYYVSGPALDDFGFKPLFVLYSYCLAVLLHALFNLVDKPYLNYQTDFIYIYNRSGYLANIKCSPVTCVLMSPHMIKNVEIWLDGIWMGGMHQSERSLGPHFWVGDF